MMSGQNGSRQVIEAVLAGPAQVSLSASLAIVMAVADHACAAAVEADNAVRPAELTNDVIALGSIRVRSVRLPMVESIAY